MTLPLRDRFWRDVAIAAGPRSLDPDAIRDAVEDMMRNYGLDDVPRQEPEPPPDPSHFARHSTFSPVFARCSSLLPSWGCFNRPVLVKPRRRPSSECFPSGTNPGIQASDPPTSAPAQPGPAAVLIPPHHYVWSFPTGHLAWTPHPQPHPLTPHGHPLSPWSAIAYTGGHPLPGTLPQWTPGTWPPRDFGRPTDVPIRLSPYLIPNPNNACLPLLDWDVTKHPSSAKRLTPNHVVVGLASVLSEPVTHTQAERVLVACDVGHLSALWGPIVVVGKPVRVSDLMDAIYAYFQLPLSYAEVRYVLDLHPVNYRRMTAAYRARCRASAGLDGWEARQGYKRADVLGDVRYWWGVWIGARDGVWWLNLGLINLARRAGR